MQLNNRPNRRELFTGHALDSSADNRRHISSAVITAPPAKMESVLAHLANLEGVEIHAAEGAKVVVVLEGPSSGYLGAKLIEMTLIEGVISANMVCELVDPAEDDKA